MEREVHKYITSDTVTLFNFFRKQYGNIYQTMRLFQQSILAIFEII